MIANPGSGSPGPPGAPIRGRGWGRGIVLPKNPGPGDFCFQNPGVFGGFFKRFLSEKWEIRGTIFTFSTKNYLKILIWPRLQQIFRSHQKFYLNLFSDQIDLILGVIFWEKLWNNSDIMHPPPPGPPVRGQHSKGRGPRGRGIYVPNFPRGRGIFLMPGICDLYSNILLNSLLFSDRGS